MDLVESKARTRTGGTTLKLKAFSSNFQEMGALLCQQMWDTKRVANSGEGRETPAEFKWDDKWSAHNIGSPPFFSAIFVSSRTLSQIRGHRVRAINGSYVVDRMEIGGKRDGGELE